MIKQISKQTSCVQIKFILIQTNFTSYSNIFDNEHIKQ